MPQAGRFDHRFADQIPDDLSEGMLYVSMKFGTVIHLCACGCGSQTVTPLGPADYKLIYDGETITLHPSIGNRSFPCRSHYLIRNSKVIWVDDWTKGQAAAFRALDRDFKGQLPCEGSADESGATAALEQSTHRGPAAGVTDVPPEPDIKGLVRHVASHLRRRQ